MKYNDIINYIDGLDNLTKIDFSIEKDEYGDYFVSKTKETFTYDDEEEADRKVNEARQCIGFAGVDKKFKQGKVNRAGEVVRPDTWTVVVKINQ